MGLAQTRHFSLSTNFPMTRFHYPLLDTKFRFRVHNIISNIIHQYLPTKSHILDLGCAGGNIAKLTQGKHLVTGVENNSFYFQSAHHMVLKHYWSDVLVLNMALILVFQKPNLGMWASHQKLGQRRQLF